jgi:type III pantothenate kinase
MLLLIDIGNTRIKWALSNHGSLEQQHAAAHAGWMQPDCDAAFASLPVPTRILVSNVAGDRIGNLVRDAAKSRWALDVEFIHASAAAGGIRNAYDEPAKLGVDRWLAMIGAYAEQRRSVCVVSVGTAATIDGVDSSGRHLGGVIVPGPDLMVESLLRNTSEIARRAEQGSVGQGVFANNTLGAIRQGAAHALAALVERAVESLQQQTGEQPMLVMTGGASAAVGALVRVPYVATTDLVLRGLAVLASDA